MKLRAQLEDGRRGGELLFFLLLPPVLILLLLRLVFLLLLVVVQEEGGREERREGEEGAVGIGGSGDKRVQEKLFDSGPGKEEGKKGGREEG